MKLNGDFHQFEFKGSRRIWSTALRSWPARAGERRFPPEPALDGFSYSPVPGNLGQVWLGVSRASSSRCPRPRLRFRTTWTRGRRNSGRFCRMAIVPGNRTVSVTLELFGQDDAATTALYQAARQQSPSA